MAYQVGSEALETNNVSHVEISALSVEEQPQLRINNYGSVVSLSFRFQIYLTRSFDLTLHLFDQKIVETEDS